MKSFKELMTELSDDKLRAYGSAAADDARDNRMSGDQSPRARKRMSKRYTGMQRAAARLRREQIEENEERAKDSLAVMRGKMTRKAFLDKHHGGKNGSYAEKKPNEQS